jgi:hypothetical protein
MAMKVGEGKISLKSGYDKFIRLDKSGHLSGVCTIVPYIVRVPVLPLVFG